MVFSSLFFLFYFLPVALLLYFSSPGSKIKLFTLSIISLFFYYIGESYLLAVMMTSIIVDYFCGLALGHTESNGNGTSKTTRKKFILGISMFVNLLLLFYFKYFNFFTDSVNSFLTFIGAESSSLFNVASIALPLGISFYTFQSMSYTIDVYRGNIQPSRSFVKFCAYVSMFPQLIAGPIVRYRDIEDQINNLKIRKNDIAEGIKRFIIGLSKKVLIANNMGPVADAVFALPADELSFGMTWLGIIAYSLQIFFDFSGYSDMAIGLGRILGFQFPENFNFPYIAKSIQDFWRRWHISLSTWFRDYLYIPLGGNRLGVTRTYVNLIIVFFVTGMWHGASWNFIFWGMFHGLFLIFERVGLSKVLRRIPVVFSHIYTLMVVVVGWVFFRAETLQYGVGYLGKMFDPINLSFDISAVEIFVDTRFVLFLIIGLVMSTPIYYIGKKQIKRLLFSENIFESLKLIMLILMFGICILSLSSDSYNPFLYYKF